MPKVTKFDAAEYLDSPEMIAAYLNEAFASKDTAFIAIALGTVARAKGMAKVAEKTGLGRESLYKSLSESGNPSFETVSSVLDSFGMHIEIKPDRAA